MKVEELIFAKCVMNTDPWNGQDTGLELNTYYVLETINIGQSNSSVVIDGKSYNSVLFEFYDSKLKEIDIYRSKYSPYFKKKPMLVFNEEDELTEINAVPNMTFRFSARGLDIFSTEEPKKIEEDKEIEFIGAEYYDDEEYTPEQRINVCMNKINELYKAVNELKKGK